MRPVRLCPRDCASEFRIVTETGRVRRLPGSRRDEMSGRRRHQRCETVPPMSSSRALGFSDFINGPNQYVHLGPALGLARATPGRMRTVWARTSGCAAAPRRRGHDQRFTYSNGATRRVTPAGTAVFSILCTRRGRRICRLPNWLSAEARRRANFKQHLQNLEHGEALGQKAEVEHEIETPAEAERQSVANRHRRCREGSIRHALHAPGWMSAHGLDDRPFRSQSLGPPKIR